MSEITWWAIVSYFIYAIVLFSSFSVFLKRTSGEGVRGQMQFPKKYQWIFSVGMVGVWITLLNPVIFLFYANVQNFLLPIAILESLPFEIVGVTLISGGCLLITIAMLRLGISARIYTPTHKTKLVTSGIYKFSRNPAYLGYYISTVGVFFLLPSVVYLVSFVLILIGYHIKILQEENFLRERFGAEYETYCQKVGRYWLKIVRM